MHALRQYYFHLVHSFQFYWGRTANQVAKNNMLAFLCDSLYHFQKPIRGECKRKVCCLCCERRIVSLSTQLDRSAYCCGESLRVKADIDNQSDEETRLKLKLVQVCYSSVCMMSIEYMVEIRCIKYQVYLSLSVYMCMHWKYYFFRREAIFSSYYINCITYHQLTSTHFQRNIMCMYVV